MKKVLLVAAENDALINTKVGGMGDVIRDLPTALATCQVSADVAMPEYGFLKDYYNAEKVADVLVPYGNNIELVTIYKMLRPATKQQVKPSSTANDDSQWVYLFAHSLFNQADGSIYTQGSADQPFADDANKFALFCLAVAQALVEGKLGRYEVMHLHDWHTAMLAMLRHCLADFSALKQLKCVFTIHNLAIQGIRPYSGMESSFCHWFSQWFSAEFVYHHNRLPHGIMDPRYPNCVNPMRMGIVMSDTVHVVSPTYATEILRASDPAKGFFGGEGLEHDLQEKADKQQLVGIINGCNYPIEPVVNAKTASAVSDRLALLNCAQEALIKWQGNKASVSATDFVASQRVLQQLFKCDQLTKKDKPGLLVTSVGRLTAQKVMLFLQPLANGKTALASILSLMKQHQPDGLLIIAGSGDEQLSLQIKKIVTQYDNCIFLNGYDEEVADKIYQLGDLFLMPSSFEPCGISQMLAMKQGQPCLVHGVGGLKDTVLHQQNGWVFLGDDTLQQAENFVEQFSQCLNDYGTKSWSAIKKAASEARFDWESVAVQYNHLLY